MPEDEQAAADPAAGSEPAEGTANVSAPERAAISKLGRVPYCQEELAGEGTREPSPCESIESGKVPLVRPRRQRFRLRPVAAWAGLVLFVGCLYGLLSSNSRWTPPPAPRPNAGMTGTVVVIDPGHGGTDSGAIAQGVVEKDLNLDVGLRLARILGAAGYNVKLTRADDHYVPLEARVATANALPGAVFVSIHFNDAQGEGRRAASRASGIETYYSGAKELAPATDLIWTSLFHAAKPVDGPAPADAIHAGAQLADAIQRALIAHTAAADRGIKEEGLFVTRRVRGPAVLVEGGFVSHPQEARLLQDPAYRERIANSIAEGIVKFLGSAQPAAGGSPPPRA